MPLRDLIHELFTEHGKCYFNDLGFEDQAKLAAAYIRENEDVIFDLFANVHQTSLAHHFAELYYSVGKCNTFRMCEDIRLAMVRSKDIEDLVDGQIDWEWRSWESEREQTIREAAYDSAREIVA